MYRGSTTSTLSASPTRRVLSPLPEARARTTCRWRLKYAGIDAAIISDVAQAIAAVADEAADDTFYAVANYTAFPPLVKELDG